MPRKLSALVAIAVLAALLLPVTQAIAAPATVTGTITIREKATLSPNAVAFISIVGQQADPSAGGIVGFQRIDGATAPVQFSVPYDTTQIDPKQSYALFASIVDGSTAYQSFEPVPVITGGPTSGVDVVVTNAPPSVPGAVTGTITSAAKVVAVVVGRGRRRARQLDDRDDGVAPGHPDARQPPDRLLDRRRSRRHRSRPTPTSRRPRSSTATTPGRGSMACPPSRTARC